MVDESLARLRELARALPRPGCEWEEQPRFEPPALPEQVAAFERTAGFPLPTDLCAFLAACGAVVGMSVHNGYWIGGVEQLARSLERGDFPRVVSGESAVPVATDGAGNAFLLSASGRVWRWERETSDVAEVAGAFAAFLARVADDWTAYLEDTPDWEYLV